MMIPISIVIILSLAIQTSGNGPPLEDEQPFGLPWMGNATVWAELMDASPEFRSRMIVHHIKMVPQLADLLHTNRFVQILTECIRAGFNIQSTLMLNEPEMTHKGDYSESWIEDLTLFGEAFYLLTNSTLGSLHASAVKLKEFLNETAVIEQNSEEMKSSNGREMNSDEKMADSIKRVRQMVKEVFEMPTVTFPAHGYNIGRRAAKLINPRSLIMTMTVQGLLMSSGAAADQWLSPEFPSNFMFLISEFLSMDDYHLKIRISQIQSLKS